MGGNAIQGVRRITGDEARNTLPKIRLFLDKFGISISVLIGSAWNRTEGSSGDLDIGITASRQIEFTSFINTKIGKYVNGKPMPGICVYSFSFPINGDDINGRVQVDLMPVYYLEWSNFIYSKVSGKMKSAHRNWVLWSLAKSKGIKFDLNKGASRNGINGIEHIHSPDYFLKWLDINLEQASSYENLASIVSPSVLYEANQKLISIK